MSSALSSAAPPRPGPRGFLRELRDAVSLRVLLLTSGVLLLRLGSIVTPERDAAV
ncbi:hypothetical protein [Peterkaempfera sp. SMS 1(5)a]|uniref:hypothetical protein n=1 Tax=Peterkaempfera podocarpi TaxID=3232308 RepID=UPI0036705507